MKSVKSLVDEYADITRQIKALEPKQASLAEQIKVKGAGRQDGTTVALLVSSVSGRRTTDWAGVCAEAGVTEDVVSKHTTKGPDTLRITVVL